MVITSLYRYFRDHPEKLPEDLFELGRTDGMEVAAKDHIAGMTDRYALNLYSDIFVPGISRSV